MPRNLLDHDTVIERDVIVDGAMDDSDPDAPFIVITKSLTGDLIVASTHGAPLIEEMLDEAPYHLTQAAKRRREQL